MHTGRAWWFKILESFVCIIKLKILYAYADIFIVLCSKIQNSSYVTVQYQSSVALQSVYCGNAGIENRPFFSLLPLHGRRTVALGSINSVFVLTKKKKKKKKTPLCFYTLSYVYRTCGWPFGNVVSTV